MGPKHKEMDSIIKNIYELLREKDSLDGKRSLILVAGDHGMADVTIYCPCMRSFVEWKPWWIK